MLTRDTAKGMPPPIYTKPCLLFQETLAQYLSLISPLSLLKFLTLYRDITIIIILLSTRIFNSPYIITSFIYQYKNGTYNYLYYTQSSIDHNTNIHNSSYYYSYRVKFTVPLPEQVKLSLKLQKLINKKSQRNQRVELTRDYCTPTDLLILLLPLVVREK